MMLGLSVTVYLAFRVRFLGKSIIRQIAIMCQDHDPSRGISTIRRQADTRRLVLLIHRCGIDDAVCVFASTGIDSVFEDSIDLVIEATRACSRRFTDFVALNARCLRQLLPELARTERLGLRAIKLITAYQGRSEETELFSPVYEWANSHEGINLCHQWGSGEFLAQIATRWPNACFTIGHLNLVYAEVAHK